MTPEPRQRLPLIFGEHPEIQPQLIPLSDPAHSGLATALERCRSFPYDLEVFQRHEPETRCLPLLASADRVSLDIGANVGFYSALLSPLSARVFAWEANPRILPFLGMNTHGLGNVSILPLAASRDYGTVRFHMPEVANGDPLGHSGSGSTMNLFLDKMNIESVAVSVPALPVDALGLHDVGLMKIDVEGGELGVLEGAADTITRGRPAIIIENEYRHNPGCQDVFAFLLARDYRGYFIDHTTSHLKPFEAFSLEANQIALLDARHHVSDMSRYVFNFIFVPGEADRMNALLDTAIL